MNVLTVFLFFFLILEIYLNFQNNLLILFFPLCLLLNLTFYQLLYKVGNLFSSKTSYATIFIAYFLKKRTIQNIDFSILVWFFAYGADVGSQFSAMCYLKAFLLSQVCILCANRIPTNNFKYC